MRFAAIMLAIVAYWLPSSGHAGLAGMDVPGAKQLVVSDWGGAPITLWYLRGPDTTADAPVVFVMHGVGRDADRYLAEWRDIALKNDIVVVVPEFSQIHFPGSEGYNFGHVFDSNGKLRPRGQWAYSAIEPLFDALRSHEKLLAERYWLFGHSAGAQFVHRLVMLGVTKRMIAAISANSGSYMFPLDEVDWPFGLRGAPATASAERFASPMILMLGDADSDPNHRSLPRQQAAMAQGPHRFARGQNFYQTSREIAAQQGYHFNWSCLVVPGVAHDNAGMARAAIRVIKGSIPTPGADCALIRTDFSIFGRHATDTTIERLADFEGAETRVLRRDERGLVLEIELLAGATVTPRLKDETLEIFVLEGQVRFRHASDIEKLTKHDYLRVPSLVSAPRLQADSPTRLLVFLDPPRSTDGSILSVVRTTPTDWQAGMVSARDTGVALKLQVRDLYQEPTTGQRTWLLRAGADLRLPWERHRTIEEGYMLSGDYRLFECLSGQARRFDYRAGGYFYRAPGIVHGGPESGSSDEILMLLRTPEKLTVEFLPACAPSTNPPNENR